MSQSGLLPFRADGVSLNIISPAPVVAAGQYSRPTFAVGTGSLGIPGVAYPASTVKDVVNAIGNPALNPNDLSTQAIQYILASQDMRKAANLFLIRVTDGTDVAAVIGIKDTATPTPGDVVKFTGRCTGSGLNNLKAQFTLVPGYPAGQSVYNLTLPTPSGGFETFTGLIGYAGTTPAYSAATLLASVMAAVNNGQSGIRAASKWWVASAPATQSTTAPATTAFVSAGGTDGAGVATSALMGQDGISGRTGMYAGRGLGCAQFFIAGLTDVSVAPTMAAFAVSENCMNVGPAQPLGTATSDAITAKYANNFNSQNSVAILDHYQWYDPYNQINRWLPPSAAAAGIIAARPVEQSPGNQPEYGLSFILQTERGTNPRSGTEAAQATQAGFTWIGNPMPRGGGLFGLVNGQNASTTYGSDGINNTRLTNALASDLPKVVGFLVDALQSKKPNDATRNLAAQAVRDYLSQYDLEDSYVQCDLNNNSLTSITAGNLIIDVYAQYKAVARFITINAQGGVNVKISKLSVQQVPQAA